MVWFHPRTLLGIGLAMAASAGLLSVTVGKPFMTGLLSTFSVPAIGKLGTPMLFDMGVYLVVVGMVLMIVFELAET